MALLVVLSILALVSVLVLAFFSQATLNRQTSFASVGQARAENVAETALQTVVGDLREEMRAGSTNPPAAAGYPAVYQPSTNANMLPQRTVSNGFMTLLKESVGASNAWSGARFAFDGPVRSIAGNNTTNAAANGRYIPKIRWLRPQLMLAAETNSFQTPDWVVVTRQGPLTNAAAVTLATLTNGAAGNLSYAIGRYAYTVYDIGGLLDANVAGYSSQSGLTADDLARKGSLAMIPLAGLGGLTQQQVDDFVKWRNPAVYNSYSNFVFRVAGTNGFLYPVPGNQGFVTRQDLIGYAATNGITNALPYLTTFSRELNAPSWSPGGPFMPASYASAAENMGVANRNLPNVRASDGSTLIKERFDLGRLRWLTYKGPSASIPSGDPDYAQLYDPLGTDANIGKYFGLSWDKSAYSAVTEHGQQWIYTSPEAVGSTVPATSIKTLDQVAQKNRPPDFFELLKAGILSGSLGLWSQGEVNAVGPYNTADRANGSLAWRTNAAAASPLLFNQVPDYQILAIGANILGQYASDGYPPFIQTAGGNVIGVKSLPYQFAAGEDQYRPTADISNVYFWVKFEMWNPHRNAVLPAPVRGPSAFRVAFVNGRVTALLSQPLGYAGDPTLLPTLSTILGAPQVTDFLLNPATLGFTASTAFVDPTGLTVTNTTAANTSDPIYGRWTEPGTTKASAGIYLGKQYSLDYAFVSDPKFATSTAQNPVIDDPAEPTPGAHYGAVVDSRVQYQDWQGNWRSYQLNYNAILSRRGYDARGVGSLPEAPPYTNSLGFANVEWANVDPRDRRLGPTEFQQQGTATTDGQGLTFRSDSNSAHDLVPQVHTYTNSSSIFTVPTTAGKRTYPAYFTDNVVPPPAGISTYTYYTDPDGVTRPGDAGGRGSNPQAVIATGGSLRDRPLILNGFFRSVGDLGYAYRDQPWKTLDFASTNSADAALLDLFGNYGGTTNDLSVVAGKVNLNSAPAAVLQALLAGAAVDFSTNSAGVVDMTNSTADVTAFVNALRPAAGTVPAFLSKAQLVPFFATNAATAAYKTKAQREAPVRALADVVQTRTWNLLIDVVAQSGRYLPSSANLNQFNVEGERHYWLQVAIDRLTGQVVAQQLEPVYEQ